MRSILKCSESGFLSHPSQLSIIFYEDYIHNHLIYPSTYHTLPQTLSHWR